jgi:outer membrane protein OmpA-like peptidoglycan-associated protein
MRSLFAAVLALSLAALLAGCSLLGPGRQAYAVFFAEWSAQLDGPAQGVVNGAAQFAKQHADFPVIVAGYADPEGSPQANIDISRLRAQVVADLLVADGVPLARIQRRAHGAVGFAATSQESRRVEITIGGQ